MISSEPIQFVTGVVLDLNREMIGHTRQGGMPLSPLAVVSDGDNMGIDFFEFPIWRSNDDERQYVGDDLEPLEFFLRRKIQQLVGVISLIKIHPK